LRFGIERMAHGSRKGRLSGAAERLFEGFRGRILNFDMAAAQQFARISVDRERIGRRLEPIDAMIAAIALVHRMTLVTRNIYEFADIGLELIDPFAQAPR
jgi:predicted nucleic acid-binding protein